MTTSPSHEVQLPYALESNLGSNTIPRLNGLRAISAFIVIAYHYGLDYVPAGFGVLTFFVISGFLITWLLLKEYDRTGSVSLRNFYARRALRIFPAFYFYWIVVVVVILVAGKHIIWPQAWASFFYVTNYYQGLNGYPSSGFSHTWSLAIEEQFYFLWPVTFLLLVRTPRMMFAVLLACIALINIYRIGLHTIGVPEEYIYTALDTRIDHLFVGCALAVALKNRFLVPLWNFVGRWEMLIVIMAVLAASVAAGHVYGIPYRNTLGFAIDPILIALLIARLLSRQDPATRWLDSRPIVYLGAISYSTYLYQQLVIWPVTKIMRSASMPEVVTFISCTAAVWLVATLSYELVERRFLWLKGRFAGASLPQPALNVLSDRKLGAELASRR